MLLPQNICRWYSTSSLHGTWHGHKRRRTWASFSDIPAPLNYLTINYDSINQKFSSINVARTNSCAHNDLSVIISSDPIAFMFKMFLKALETKWKDWTKAVARSHDTKPLNSSFGSYCCLCWEQLVRHPKASLINSSVKTKQPSEVNFKPAIISPRILD